MAGTYSLGNTGIKGFDEVMKNLNEEIQKIENRSMQGLIKAAIVIRRDMDRTPPLIPIKTGNLRASWFVVTAKGLKSDRPAFKALDTPRKTAELHSSYNTAVAEAQGIVAGRTSFIVIGFGANYAAPVHEMYGKGEVEWTRTNSGPKFFESSVKRNSDKILRIIAENAQIK
jgi:hypothetical protein